MNQSTNQEPRVLDSHSPASFRTHKRNWSQGVCQPLRYQHNSTISINPILPKDHEASGSPQIAQTTRCQEKSWTHHPRKALTHHAFAQEPQDLQQQGGSFAQGPQGLRDLPVRKQSVFTASTRSSQHTTSLSQTRCQTCHSSPSPPFLSFFTLLNSTKRSSPEQLPHGHATILQNRRHQFC